MRHIRYAKNSKWLIVLIVGALLNINGLHVRTASATGPHTPQTSSAAGKALPSGAGIEYSYGVDPDKVPFVRRADGAKGRFVSLIPDHLKLQIVKGTNWGEIEFRRSSQTETLTVFTTPTGNALSFRTIASTSLSEGREPLVDLVVQLGREKVVLKGDQVGKQEPLPTAVERQLQKISAGVRADRTLGNLMSESSFFVSREVMTGFLAYLRVSPGLYFLDSMKCLDEAAYCVLALSSYVFAIGALIAVCPETIGATCIAAMLAHPVYGYLVASRCSRAINACGVSNTINTDKTLGGN